MNDDVGRTVRDFRWDPIERRVRRNVSYLRYAAPVAATVPVRVHPIEVLEALRVQSRDAKDAWVRHAASATASPVFPHVGEIRGLRELGEAIAAMVWVGTWLIASSWRSWRRRRRVDMTAASLGALDDRSLRDLGIGRSEVNSIAAEVHGEAERTRIRAMPRLGQSWLI